MIMATGVMLPIKPVFADRIFDGTKTFEFRKRIFTRRELSRIYVYATSPVQCVIGEFEVVEILAKPPHELWHLTHFGAGTSEQYFTEYFGHSATAYAMRIGQTLRYEHPLALDTGFNVRYAPQSFIYVTPTNPDCFDYRSLAARCS
jgi:predicted transcriptional regulator